MECCLELLDRGLLVALQDLGAAGLTSSSAEMASAGGVGMDIDVDRVPLREADMEPFEIMVSESQERMLAVVEPPGWWTTCWRSASAGRRGPRAIGEVTDTGRIRVLAGGEVVGDVPVAALVDECPLYDLEPEEPDGWLYGNRETLEPRCGRRRDPPDAARLAERRVEAVGVRAVRLDRPVADRAAAGGGGRGGAGAPGERSGRSRVAIDGNGRRVACDPYRGTVEAVLECAQNLACVGAEPLGCDQLPQLRQPGEAPRRLAARPLGAGPGRRVRGARGAGRGRQRLALQRDRARSDLSHARDRHGRRAPRPELARSGIAPAAGDAIAVVGPFAPSLAGSELAKLRGDLDRGLPGVEIADVRAAIELVRDTVRAGGGLRRPRRQRRRARVRPRRVRDRGSAWASGPTSTRSSSSAAAPARAPVRRGSRRVRRRRP